ncbi:MAG: hypothetical protein JSV83_01140 [Desulfobacterales bacterium]|nr:MAG: hypothetical protein JSV83_01140 [Desulfobacterales bacterium]
MELISDSSYWLSFNGLTLYSEMIVTANMVDRYSPKKLSKIKSISESSFCVEIDAGRPLPIYQFQLRSFTSNEATILVNKESSLIDHLKIGEKIKIRYWSIKAPWSGEFFDAEIKHIKKQDGDRNKEPVIVVFEILKNQNFNLDKIAQLFLSTNDEINIFNKRNRKNKKTDINLTPDRRQMSNTEDLPERRSGKQRRKDFDRRSGSERRKSLEQRSAKKLL